MDRRFVISPLAGANEDAIGPLSKVRWINRTDAAPEEAVAEEKPNRRFADLTVWRGQHRANRLRSFLSGKSRGQGEGFERLAALGIAGPCVVGQGYEALSGRGFQEVLLVEFWPQGKFLDDFFACDYQTLDFRLRRSIVRRFGQFLNSLFEQGIDPAGLSLEHFWINDWHQGGEFRVATVHDFSWKKSPLTQKRRLLRIGQLSASLLTRTDRSERLRFFLAVFGNRMRLRDNRSCLAAVEKKALCVARRVWQAEARRSLTNNASFVISRQGGQRVWRQRSTEASNVLADMLSRPKEFFSKGSSMGGRGSGCDARRVQLAGRTYLVKRYRFSGPRYAIKYLFVRSKALAAWHVSWQFLVRNLPVARPLLVLENRSFGLLREAYLVVEFCEDGKTLMDLWPQLAGKAKNNLIIQCAHLFAKVHMCLCIHGDSNWNNILKRSNGDLLLVDLDCAKVLRSFSYVRAYRDLEHFVRDLRRKRNNGVEFLGRFISQWRSWLALTGRVSDEMHSRVVIDNPGRKIDDCI